MANRTLPTTEILMNPVTLVFAKSAWQDLTELANRGEMMVNQSKVLRSDR